MIRLRRRCVPALVPAIAMLLLAGCEPPDNARPSSDSSPVSEPIPLASAPPVEISSLPLEISSPITPPSNAPLPAEGNTLTSGEVLDRLRARLSTPTCIVGPNNTRWRHKYAGYPQHFADEVQNVLPMMLVVLDQLEQNKLPGEFALIPIVESWYQPDTHSFGGAAGMWQMLSETSRNNGATVVNGYDGRLSALDSTEAALTYLSKLHGMFNDWRLAAMAYNSGEYRLMRTMSPEELAERGAGGVHYRRPQGLSFTTYEYVSKMRALTCLLAQPERQGIPLLTDVPITHWIPYTLPADVDSLDELARRLGTDAEQLKAFNRGYHNGRVVSDAPRMVLVPASTRPRWASAGAPAPRVPSTTATSAVPLAPIPPSFPPKPVAAFALPTSVAQPAVPVPTRNPINATPQPNPSTSAASQAAALANVAHGSPTIDATAKPVGSATPTGAATPATFAHASPVAGTFSPPATTPSVSPVQQSTAPTSKAAVAAVPGEARPSTAALHDAPTALDFAPPPQTKPVLAPDSTATTSKPVVTDALSAAKILAPSRPGSSSPTTTAPLPSSAAKATPWVAVTAAPSSKPAVEAVPGDVKTSVSSDAPPVANGAHPPASTSNAPARAPAPPSVTATTPALPDVGLKPVVSTTPASGPESQRPVSSGSAATNTPALRAPDPSPVKPVSAPTATKAAEQTSTTPSRTPSSVTPPTPSTATPHSSTVVPSAGAPTPAPSSSDQTGPQSLPRTHKVVLGDSLEMIAKRFNVTVDDLRSWNHLAPGSGLFVDQVLKLEP
jgi:membrane-bound lytic murein transglycosylase D